MIIIIHVPGHVSVTCIYSLPQGCLCGSFFLSSYFFMGKLSYRSVRPGSLKQLNRVKCTVTGGVTVRSTIFTGLSPVIRWICPGQSVTWCIGLYFLSFVLMRSWGVMEGLGWVPSIQVVNPPHLVKTFW